MKHCRFLTLAIIATLFSYAPSTNAASIHPSIHPDTGLAHTWVADYGSDSNSGAYSSPYLDFATAIANTAAGGEVSVLTPGEYGACTITQSITIDGGGPRGSVSFSGGEGVFINVAANATVVLRNLDVDGGGVGSDGIFVQSSGSTVTTNVTIDNCQIHGCSVLGIGVGSEGPMNVSIVDTNITGGTLGLRTYQSSGNVVYDHVSMRNCVINGITGTAPDAAVFSRNGTMDATNCSFVNSTIGLECDTSAEITAMGCTISGNPQALVCYTSSTIQLLNDSLLNNTVGIASDGGTVVTLHGNISRGNTTPGEANANAATF